MGKKRRYITGLDGIRAIAVIMVLAYHLKLALFQLPILMKILNLPYKQRKKFLQA